MKKLNKQKIQRHIEEREKHERLIYCIIKIPDSPNHPIIKSKELEHIMHF